MEIRDFAMRVLQAETLEEKLASPGEGRLTDNEPAGASPSGFRVPGMPGRPANLGFAPQGHRAKWPGPGDLGNAEARAVLLHAFANHELLAVELMALALLRFPDAPAAFRKGLVHTLQEEQEHTRLYQERMEAEGVRMGDLPVNGFFWKHISAMATPLEYVSHLSLTFEQANLDYARHYAQLFHRLGDGETAGLLNRIYEDEIGHVGYGLTWFRRWKDPQREDWEAWKSTMTFPLSPARAKGNVTFNREGRVRAGFSESFIENLDLYAQSKGRTPWIGWFNPGAEAAALSRNPEGAPEAAMAELAGDLETLPGFSLNVEDVVLVSQLPRPEYLRRLREAGINLPQWEALDGKGQLAGDSPLRFRRIGRFRPWGWSADSARVLAPLLPQAGEAAVATVPWDEEIRLLYSKTTAAGLAESVGRERGFPEETWGIPAHSVEEVRGILARWQDEGTGRACLKAPYGLAGRGMIQVATRPMAPGDVAWLENILGHQGAVVVEPWLARIADFSTQYELSPGALPRWKGQVRLHNDAGGRFLACEASGAFTRLLPPEAARCLHECGATHLFQESLPQWLAKIPGLSRLYGNLGIDSFVYRDSAGVVRLRPVVEMNPRMTMGRVTLDLRRWVDPAKVSRFRIVHRKSLKKQGFPALAGYASHLGTQFPPECGETSSGRRITGGRLVLNDPERSCGFLAILEVNPGPFGQASGEG